MNVSEKKQKLLLEYLVSSTDTFAICQGIVNPSYFDPSLRNAVQFVKSYFEQYHTTPSVEQVEAETDVTLQTREIAKDQIDFCTNEVEAFCKYSALKDAILNSVKHLEKNDHGLIETEIKNALLISLNKDLGLSYFDDPDTRLETMAKSNSVISTGWKTVDDLLFGGISRKELVLVSAGSGGGKSFTLANLGYNFSEQGLNVLYISLELAENIIAQRFDTMVTGIGRREWIEHRSEIATRVRSAGKGKGQIHIKEFPAGASSNQFKAYLKEYYLHYGFMPDLLIVDYLDLMNPNERGVDIGNVWLKDKLCSEQVRNIGVEYNIVVATASQLNRQAVGATSHDHSQIAGGISKINTADVYWSILSNDAMRAAGEIVFQFQKTRNSDGVGKRVLLEWNQKTLRILDRKSPDSLVLNTKAKFKQDEQDTIKKSLLDVFDD